MTSEGKELSPYAQVVPGTVQSYSAVSWPEATCISTSLKDKAISSLHKRYFLYKHLILCLQFLQNRVTDAQNNTPTHLRAIKLMYVQ